MNKHLALISIGRLSQMLVMFLTYRVLSTVLSVPDMGIYYFLLSISSAFGLIYANPIGMYTNRMIHSWQDNGIMMRNLKGVISSLFWGSLLTIPFLFLFKEKISIEDGHWLFLVAVLVSYVFMSTLNGTIVPSLNLLGFSGHFVIWTLLTNVLGLIFSYLLVKFVSANPLYWLIGQAIAFGFCGLVGFLILLFKIKDIPLKEKISHRPRFKRVAKFAAPIVITNLAVWVLGQSFRFFYKENVDLTKLGELAFGLGMATSLSVAVEYLFQQLYLPEFYKKINSNEKDRALIWNNFFNKLIPSYLTFTLFLIGLSPFILRVLADVKFKNSFIFLAMGAGIELLRMVGNIFTMATQSELKTHKAIIPYLSGGLVALVGVLFICQYPEYVSLTPFALMAGHMTSLILLGMSVHKMIKIDFSIGSILKESSFALIFLTALFFQKESESMAISIGVGGIYGLILLFLLYRSYKNAKDSEVV